MQKFNHRRLKLGCWGSPLVTREEALNLQHPVPAGLHELDEPGIDVDVLVPLKGQHVWAV